MITTEIINLLEITRKLVNNKAELDEKYFDQFIKPAWEIFSQIHENYKSTFRSYIEFVESDDYNPKALIEKLRQDSFQTQDIRNELVAIVKNFPTAKFKVKELYLQNFSKSISNYFSVQNGFKFPKNRSAFFICDDVEFFDIQSSDSPSDSPYTPSILGDYNIGRFYSVIELSRKGNPDREDAKDVLETAVQEFQSRQKVVASAYYKLRSELLS